MEKRYDKKKNNDRRNFERRPAESKPLSGSYVIGRNAVSELLKSGRDIDKLYIKKGERTGSITVIASEAIRRNIPVIEVEGTKLDNMSGGQMHQGVIASAALKEYVSVDEILENAKNKGEKPQQS